MNMIIFASVALLAIILIVLYKNGLHNQQPDSVLRQRAVFNSHEHATFTRLKAVLPEANILAHVSFDALLTTKFIHTRRKYEKLFADFIVMDKECRVLSIISIGELNSIKKQKAAHYQDAILETAGYRVFRFAYIPDYEHIRLLFNQDLHVLNPDVIEQTVQHQLGRSEDGLDATDELKSTQGSYSY